MKTRNFKTYGSSLIIVLFALITVFSANIHASDNFEALVAMFKDWRDFERPPMLDGAPDYTEKTFALRYDSFKKYRQRLYEIDHSNWPVEQKADWYILLAEMNGFDFNYRVLKPWARDPAFYKSIWLHQSDVPAHEGPTHHMVTELWTYSFPLTKSEQARLISDLSVIAPLMKQAQTNLTGNARELWI
ncbi:MAG: hypothetical protein ACE5GL_08185, partial [Calditrichia bacterium]